MDPIMNSTIFKSLLVLLLLTGLTFAAEDDKKPAPLSLEGRCRLRLYQPGGVYLDGRVRGAE